MRKLIFILTSLLITGMPLTLLAQDQNTDSSQEALIQQDLQKLQQSQKQPQQPAAATAQQQQQQQRSQAAAAQQTQQTASRGDMSDQAFAGVVSKQLPMTPKQIEALRKAFDAVREAAAATPKIPARPTSSSVIVDLSPNAVPPIVRLGAGYISSLVFVDATGQPWPIQAYSVGDPSSFNIQWDKKGNTLLVQSDTYYKRSNLAVMLKGLDTPIMVTLLPGQSAVDYRVDLRVPGAGPNATFAKADLPSTADPILLSVLNGVPPNGARTLQVLGCSRCQAWLFNNKLYFRTSLNIISPAWQSIMTSIDGTHAYALQPTSVILALQHGQDKMLKLILEGLE